MSTPRRELIIHLADHSQDRWSVSTLAEVLTPDDQKPDLLSAFKIQLYDLHPPSPQRAGLIEYDPESKRIVSIDSTALATVVERLKSVGA